MKYISHSYEETQQIAMEFAKTVSSGDVIALDGDLGAGKTAFVSGFAKAYNYDGYVSSPTFALINEYIADVDIYHFDVYRIGDIEEMDDIGLDDYLFGDGICLIEWAQMIKPLLPKNTYYVTIKKNMDMSEDYREIEITKE